MKKSSLVVLLPLAFLSSFSYAEVFLHQNDRIQINTAFKRLEGVSCDKTAKLCVAVGFGTESHLHERFAYTSQDGGLTWSEPYALVSPKEEITPSLSDDPNPAKISCDESGQSCLIASSAIIEKIPTPIVYKTQDGGVSWSAPMVLPLPKSVNKIQAYKNNSLLLSISCDKATTTCTLVGGLSGDNESIPLIYSTQNAGQRWDLVENLQNPSYQACKCGYHGTLLTAVSCNYSGHDCIAVGSSYIRPSYFSAYYTSHPIAYYSRDGGANWSKPIVFYSGISNQTGGSFSNIACDVAGKQCTSIGYIYNFKTNKFMSFSYSTRDGGLTWEPQNLIMPQEGEYALNSIKCDNSGQNCVAIGWEVSPVTYIPVTKPIAYTINAAEKKWEKVSHLSFPNFSMLNDLFCDNTLGQCLAVGTQVEANNSIRADARLGLDSKGLSLMSLIKSPSLRTAE